MRLEVLRAGTAVEFTLNPAIVSVHQMRYLGLAPETDENSAPVVLGLMQDMPALEAGLKVGDRLLKLDADPIVSGNVLVSYLSRNGDRVINEPWTGRARNS